MTVKFEITHCCSGKVLFSSEVGSLKLAVELAVKSGANLGGAYLGGAKNVTLETGETLVEYIKTVMPAFLTAGGKPLAEVAAGWECHSWDNCPTAIAFSCHDLSGVPLLFRPRAEQFIRLFDAKLLPNPMAKEPDP